MKVIVLALVVLFLMTPGIGFAAESSAKGKVLVAYFSWSGNTREIAKELQRQVGGDLFEIVVETPYPTDYNACTDQAAKELKAQSRPALKTHVADMKSYDTVFLGYPNWWSSIPMPVATFLEEYDFAGKTIVPFCSHGGGGIAQTVSAIGKLCPKAKILEAFSAYGRGGNVASSLATWLKKIGVETAK